MKTGSFGRLASSCLLTLLLAMASSRVCAAGGSTITNLPTLGGSAFQANALNSAGQATGFSYMPGDTAAHAFLYSQPTTADLGTLGGVVSQGFALNSAGQVVGEANLAGDTVTHAFLYDGTNLLDLGTLGGSYSSAAAINDAGQVVGSSYITGDAGLSAFLWTNGTMLNLGDLGGGSSSAVAINQSGAIAGNAYTSSFDQHAFLYQNGAMTDLGTLGGPGSTAYDLNDAGVVVGDSYLPTWATHGFVYSGGVMTDIGDLGGGSSTAYAINRAGQVIGVSTLASGDSHGFLYANGSMTDLGTLGGNYSYARAINNLGEVVGDSAGADANSYAFLWRNGQMVDLNSLLETNSGWVLQVAEFINDSHRVVGIGTYNGASAWFVMDVASGNQPPVAVATGPSGPVDCAAQVTLDGSGSSDPDGDALTYQWSLSGTVLGSNPTLTVSLPIGTNVVTLTVTDPSSASSTANVTVVVADTTPPTGSCPADATAPADATCQAPVPNFISQVVASDNCTPRESLVITQNPAAGTLVGLGPHPVSVLVSDSSGNTSTCTVTFTVVDSTPPMFVSLPEPLTCSADATGRAAVPDVLVKVAATDSCTPAPQLLLRQNPVAGTMVGLCQTAITITASDQAGNSAVASVALSVVDVTPPVIQSAPVAVTVPADAGCQGTVPSLLGQVVATDNCTPANLLRLSQIPVPGASLGLGSHPVTLVASDASGNTTKCTVTLTVVDSTPPVIVSVPGPITLSADATGRAAVPNVLAGVTANDNCTPAAQLVLGQNPAAGTMLGLGQTTISVSATDQAGNRTVANVTLTVVDTTPPVIQSAPVSVTLPADAGCHATVPSLVGQVVASDNCTPANQLRISQNPAPGAVVGLGQSQLTLTVTDAADNSSVRTVVLQVVDSTPPVITSLPPTVSLTADANCQAVVPDLRPNLVASDNCTLAGQLVVTQTPAPGTVLGCGQYTVTLTVADAAGNSTSGNVALVVADKTPPVIQSIQASPNVLSPPNHQLVSVTVSVRAVDNCDPAPVSRIVSISCNETISPSEAQITGALTARLAATRNSSTGRIYTLNVQCTDASGNVTTGSVQVTVPKGSH